MTSSYKQLAGFLLVASVVACGGGSDPAASGGSGGASTSGGSAGTTAGSSMGGAIATAGSTTAGGNSSSAGSVSNGGAAGSGTATGGYCTPGTPQPAINFFGGTIDPCSSVSGLTGDVNHILDIALTNPVGPGQTFAFSVDLNAPEGDFEMYGATRECGDVGELLSTVHVTGNGIICHEVKPVTGTYSHMIWVWRVAAEMKDTAICESGTCPAH